MNRYNEELAIKDLSIAISKLLECYQWDHLPIDYDKVKIEMASVEDKMHEVESLLNGNSATE